MRFAMRRKLVMSSTLLEKLGRTSARMILTLSSEFWGSTSWRAEMPSAVRPIVDIASKTTVLTPTVHNDDMVMKRKSLTHHGWKKQITVRFAPSRCRLEPKFEVCDKNALILGGQHLEEVLVHSEAVRNKLHRNQRCPTTGRRTNKNSVVCNRKC